MDQYEIDEILRVNKFELSGEILIEEKYFGPSPKFSLFDDYKTGKKSKFKGWVYLWVHIVNNNYSNICYVGKAGGVIKDRCNQHIGGLDLALQVHKKVEKMLSELKTVLRMVGGWKYMLDKSDDLELLGEANICLCESEEKAMIQKLKRLGAELWNKDT